MVGEVRSKECLGCIKRVLDDWLGNWVEYHFFAREDRFLPTFFKIFVFYFFLTISLYDYDDL